MATKKRGPNAQRVARPSRKKIHELVDEMLVTDPRKLRINVRWLLSACHHSITRPVLELLIHRAFGGDSTATVAVGFFGDRALPTVLDAFRGIEEAERQMRLIEIFKQCAPQLSTSDYCDVGYNVLIFERLLSPGPRWILRTAFRGLRQQFESRKG